MNYTYTYETAIGTIQLEATDAAITKLLFGTQPTAAAKTETPLIKTAHRQLAEYLAGSRRVFDLPLSPQGTPFQKTVWTQLLKIPYGETASYGEIARMAGNPKACRAVGMANNRNPISIFIPCHRVIGADGSLTGYGGGLEIKRFLLELEGAAIK